MRARRQIGTVALVLVAVVVVWGGYGRHWSWTGINGRTATLWDWLHLLLLPAAFGLLAILLEYRHKLDHRHKLAILLALGAFAALVLVGYVIPWSWTGFTGNTLWDWLELIALPLAIGLSPLLDDLRKSWSGRHTAVALAAGGAFAVALIGGYAGHWAWTGFRGNTLWDWLHLLLLPVAMPALVVPRLKQAAAATLEARAEP